MSDTLVAKGSDAKYKSHPEGQYVAQCVDTIDLGDKVEEFPGTPSKLVHKCALVFRTGEKNDETGEFIDIAREFTVSMGEKANLRKFLEQWRGRAYKAEELEAGVPLHKLTGNYATITVAHNVSKQGRTYAVLMACVGVPKQMAANLPQYVSGYSRADYWTTRKQEYADAARKFKSANVPPDDDDFPAALQDGPDDLPF